MRLNNNVIILFLLDNFWKVRSKHFHQLRISYFLHLKECHMECNAQCIKKEKLYIIFNVAKIIS